jgi:hypothetical protein
MVVLPDVPGLFFAHAPEDVQDVALVEDQASWVLPPP